MLIDARHLRPGASLTADVAVVGAGPSGIVLALELAKGGLDVLLLESGGPTARGGSQRLGDAAALDPGRHAPMSVATRRQVGGTSAIWGGRCVPYDPIDFESRSFVSHADWPISYEDVAALLPRACRWLQCGEASFDASEVAGLSRRGLVPGLPDGRCSPPRSSAGRSRRTSVESTGRACVARPGSVSSTV